uniref:F-box domain-containing protein n=1 Tax=Setaria italica TaxID=4555 RepID=A0A0Q3Q7C3_SETIT
MRKGSRRGSSSPPFPLPLDLVLEIAALSDPATLVRCVAASKDLHRRIADPAFHGRLRLRHADRFVPSSCAATWSI